MYTYLKYNIKKKKTNKTNIKKKNPNCLKNKSYKSWNYNPLNLQLKYFAPLVVTIYLNLKKSLKFS